MSETLYRKYRPLDFGSIVGQNHIKITLQKAVASGKISHAYLFTGPRGVGKTTTARVLAKAINCLQAKDGEPCNQCAVCQGINKGSLLDLVELDAASRRKIDEIKEFKEHIKYPPNIAKYKVFIIDEVHMLTEVSFNALLKTLEEPPKHSIFILCTTAIHKIPETIISRCQRFDFKRLPTKDIVDNLAGIAQQEKIKIDNKIYQAIARLSEGSLRDAQSLMNQIIALGDKNISWDEAAMLLPRSDIDLAIKFWQHLITNQSAEAISLIGKLVDEGVDLFYFTDEVLELMRNLLLLKIDKKLDRLLEMLPREKYQELTQQLANVSLDWLKKSLDIMLNRRQQLKFNQIEQLPLELAVIEIANLTETGKDNDNINSGPTAFGALSNPTTKNFSSSAAKNTDATATKSFNQKIRKQLIEKISTSNYSLAGILKSAVLKITENILMIEVGHDFHKEQITKDKNLHLIKNTIDDIMENKFSIEVTVDQKAGEGNIKANRATEKNRAEPNDSYVDDIIKVLGGRVVESGVVEE